MHTHPDIVRSVAVDQYRNRLDEAERDRIAAAVEGHRRFVDRMRSTLTRVRARDRRLFRPVRAS
jgi:hypothetical protein